MYRLFNEAQAPGFVSVGDLSLLIGFYRDSSESDVILTNLKPWIVAEFFQ